jgi:DNA-binding MarR family transcriptional regulator
MTALPESDAIQSSDAGRSGPGLELMLHDERIDLMGLLITAHSKLSKALGAELEERLGLPLSWFDALIHLGRAPEGHLTMSQLANDVSFTSGGITRLVDRLTDAGLVERQNCPSDRRTVFVALTPAGQELLAKATVEHLDGIERHLFAPLDSVDRIDLARVLTKLVGTSSVCGGPPPNELST